jgi:hypothetical protein
VKPVGKTSCLEENPVTLPTTLGPYRKNQDFAANPDTQNQGCALIMQNNRGKIIILGKIHSLYV